VFLILVNSFWATFTFSYYELDTIGFIERFCENKEKPKLQCNGKCHLKKVAESQDKKQKRPENIIDFRDLVLYQHSPITGIEGHVVPTAKGQKLVPYQNLYAYHIIIDCFRPPWVEMS
jgi:hypothetical protein